MTIHFHSKHFIETGMHLNEYMILMCHENCSIIPVLTLMKYVGMSERQTYRLRTNLVSLGYLKQGDIQNEYYLTDKLYPPCIQKKI